VFLLFSDIDLAISYQWLIFDSNVETSAGFDVLVAVWLVVLRKRKDLETLHIDVSLIRMF